MKKITKKKLIEEAYKIAERMLANPKNKKPAPTTKRLKQITLTLPRGQRIGQAMQNFRWKILEDLYYLEDSEFLKLWDKFIK
mgnify:CR=1 FL=1